MTLVEVFTKRIAKSQPLQFMFLGLSLIAFNAFLNSFIWTKEGAAALPESLRLVLPLLGIITIMVGITMEAYGYLRRARRSTFFDLNSETGDIQHQLRSIRSEFSKFHTQRRGLGDADREKIRDRVVAEITQDTVKLIAEEWDRKLRPKVQEDRHIEAIRRIAGEMQERLSQEIDALGRRSNLNLIIGFFISMSGLVILGWFVVTTASELSSGIAATDIAIRFGIRLSLVVF